MAPSSQHREVHLQGGDKTDVLSVYCKQAYATCFHLYLGHHQANSIYFNLLALIWIHIMHFIAVLIISEYTLKNVNNINKLKRNKLLVKV
jgi:hypothetical protein